jgi:hypothetical protein
MATVCIHGRQQASTVTGVLQVRDMEPGSAVWIVKPSITNQGAGIAVIDSCAGLRSVLEGAHCQRQFDALRLTKPSLDRRVCT